MIQYVLAGLAFGSVYAIASSAIVATYRASGILNFAFGATAYSCARSYYFFNTQERWGILPSALITLFVIAPGLGLALWWLLFRHLRLASQFIKVASTIGLSVALPAICSLIFGNSPIQLVPGLAPQPVHVFHPFGVAISLDTVITFACTVVVIVAGGLLLRYSLAGLKVRATVDSEAMASLTGISPTVVSMSVAVAATFLAALAGILVGPLIGLTIESYLSFMTAAFAAVIAARLRSIGGAVAVSLAMGVALGLIQEYLPPDSSVTGDIINCLPLGVIVLALVWGFVRGGYAERESVSGKLDRAIQPVAADNGSGQWRGAGRGPGRPRDTSRVSRRDLTRVAVGFALLLLCPLVFGGYWGTLIASGLAYAVVFLPIMIVSGQGGMIWLCQITFAGIGAITIGQLSGVHGWPPLLSVLFAGFAAIPLGLLVGWLTIRLGELYIALVTVTVGLLFEALVYTIPQFYVGGLGVSVNRPSFASSDRAFSYLLIAILLVLTLFFVNLRKSTTGMALRAAYSSPQAARAIGVSVSHVRLLTATFCAFGSGVGGALLAMFAGAAVTDSYLTFTGLTWFAVVATVGLRSLPGTVAAGLAFAVVPGVFSAYLPLQWAAVPTALVGMGAVLVARNPDGLAAMHGRQLAAVSAAAARLARRARRLPAGPEKEGAVPAMEAEASAQANQSVLKPRADAERPVRADREPCLVATGVAVHFGGLRAVDGVSLAVLPGQVTGLIGPNGAGKTTLLGAISGLVRVRDGDMSMLGRSIDGLSPHQRARLGLGRTFQHAELFADLTVREHLLLADRVHAARRRLWEDSLTARAMRPADNAEQRRIDETIAELNLQEVADFPALGLPLGLSRLVEVARALAASPRVLLLDEPSTGLDAAETEMFSRTLVRLARERDIGMLLVEHDLSMVQNTTVHVYALNFGTVIAEGTPEQVWSSPLVQEAYLGTATASRSVDPA